MRSTRVPALAAGLLLLTFAAPAAAIPPGGPVERRDGATLTVTSRLVAPGGDVAFSGTGFGAGTVVSIKLDDGLVLPTTPVAGTDVFTTVTADGGGAISGTFHVADVRAADASTVASGVHRLRLLSSTPAHSVHADFAVKAPTGPPEVLNGASAFVAPPADQLLDLPLSGDADAPYDDLPRLVEGSAIPYRLAGFDAGQSVTVKVDDGANLAVTNADGSGAKAGYGPADGLALGTHWLRFLAGVGGGTVHSVRAPFAVVANDGRDVLSSTDAVPGGAVAFNTKGLVRAPADYVPLPAKGQTLEARLGGTTGTPVRVTADASGAASGLVPVPPGTAPGTYDVAYWVGFAVQNDFPQAVLVRRVAVADALPAASAQLGGGATATTGGSMSYTLQGFAKNVGGGQKVAVAVDGGAPLACVTTDVTGGATGGVTLPAAVGAGAHTVAFRAGTACDGSGDEAPQREVETTLTVTAAPPAVTPPIGQPAPAPRPPVARPARVVKPAIGSASLRVASGKRVTFVVRPGSTTVRTTVSLRTSAAVKLTPRSQRRKVITLARRALTIKPGGASKAITLTLTRDAKTLLKTHRSIKVKLSIVPASGTTIARTLTLRR